jgi:hypothetical protein
MKLHAMALRAWLVLLVAGLLSSAFGLEQQQQQQMPVIHSRQLLAATFAMGTATEESLFLVSKDEGSVSTEIEGSASTSLSINENEGAQSDSESTSDLTIEETSGGADFVGHTQVQATGSAAGADTAITHTGTTSERGVERVAIGASNNSEDEDDTPAFGSTFAMGIADAIATGDDSETDTEVGGSGGASVQYEEDVVTSLSETLGHGTTGATGMSDEEASSYSTFTIEQDVDGSGEFFSGGAAVSGTAELSLTGTSIATGDVTSSDSQAKGASQSLAEPTFGTTDEAYAMGEAAITSHGMSFYSPAGSGFHLESSSGADVSGGTTFNSMGEGAVGFGNSGAYTDGKAVGYSEGKFTNAHASLTGASQTKSAGVPLDSQDLPLLLGTAAGYIQGMAASEDHEIGVGYSALAKVEGESSAEVDLLDMPNSSSGMGIGGGVVSSQASGVHTQADSGTGGSGDTLLFTGSDDISLEFERIDVKYASAGGEGDAYSQAEGAGYSTTDSGTSAGGSVSTESNDPGSTGNRVVGQGDAYSSSDARGDFTYTSADAAGHGQTFAFGQSTNKDTAFTQGAVDAVSGTEAYGSRYGLAGSEASALGRSQSQYEIPNTRDGEVTAGSYAYLEGDAGGYGRAVNSGAGIASTTESKVLAAEVDFSTLPNAFAAAIGGSSAFGSNAISATAQKTEPGAGLDSYVSIDGGSGASVGVNANAKTIESEKSGNVAGYSDASGFSSGSGGGSADTKGDSSTANLAASGSGDTSVGSGAFAYNKPYYGAELFTVAVGGSVGDGDGHVRAYAEGENVYVEGGAGGSGYAGTTNDAIPSTSVVHQNGDYGKGFSGADAVTYGDKTYVSGGSAVEGSTTGYTGYEKYYANDDYSEFSSGNEMINAESEGEATFLARGPHAVGWSDTSAITNDHSDTATALLDADSEAELYGYGEGSGMVVVDSTGHTDAELVEASGDPHAGAAFFVAGDSIGFGFAEQVAETDALIYDDSDSEAESSTLSLAAALSAAQAVAFTTEGLSGPTNIAYAGGALGGAAYSYPQVTARFPGPPDVQDPSAVLSFDQRGHVERGPMAAAEYTVSDIPAFAEQGYEFSSIANDGSVAVGTGGSAARGGTTNALAIIEPFFVNSMATGVGIAGKADPSMFDNMAEVDFMGGMGDPTITLDSETIAYAESGEVMDFGP